MWSGGVGGEGAWRSDPLRTTGSRPYAYGHLSQRSSRRRDHQGQGLWEGRSLAGLRDRGRMAGTERGEGYGAAPRSLDPSQESSAYGSISDFM